MKVSLLMMRTVFSRQRPNSSMIDLYQAHLDLKPILLTVPKLSSNSTLMLSATLDPKQLQGLMTMSSLTQSTRELLLPVKER